MIRQTVGLKLRKNRDGSGLFMIEGEKFVKELPDDWEVRYFVVAESYSGDTAWYEARADVRYVSDAVFKAVSDTVTPQGVLAVVRQKKYGLDTLRETPFILMCEDIQDPGNLGTILRTADASGCDCVILSKGSVDVYNPKVLRAAAGSVFHIPVLERAVLMETAAQLKSRGVRVIAARPGSPNWKAESPGWLSAHETDFTVPCAILIGNEGRGLSDAALALADASVSIPMPGRAESLNASVAAAILMYEAVRQRLV